MMKNNLRSIAKIFVTENWSCDLMLAVLTQEILGSATRTPLSSLSASFCRAMHVVLARYCYRMSPVRPSVCPLYVCDVDVPWTYKLN